MNPLPFATVRYLRTLALQQLKPLCLLMSKQYHLVHWWGDALYYGYEGLRSGEDCRTRLPFLYGLENLEPLELPFVETPNGRAAHIHLRPGDPRSTLFFIDATEERQRHQAIQQTANEVRLLNHQQERLMEQLRTARDELEVKRRQAEDANRLKSRFIAGMSHEFRTPLTSILGYAQRLRERVESPAGTTGELDAIERGARHLLALVDNLLDQGRLDTGEVVIRPAATDLCTVIQDMEAIFLPLAAEKGLNFTLQSEATVPSIVMIDELRLRQVIVNLVGNAIKFTKQGSVAAKFAWEDGTLAITVTDTGPGIAAAHQDQIFLAFQRVGQSAHPGAGLGLSITKQLVERMGGRLNLESALGKGSRFCVKLPTVAVEEPFAASSVPRDKQPVGVEGKTVLLAEDDDAIAELLALYLEEAGLNLLSTRDGQQAVDLALHRHPDLVLTDMHLPRLDGCTVISQLREAGFTSPIIAMTASVSEEDRRHAMAVGCDRFLIKPIKMPQLVATVLECLRKHQTAC